MKRQRITLPNPRRLIVAVFAVLVLAGAVGAYPKPAVVPYRWELQFRSNDLRMYVDPLNGEAFWYFTYQVVNRTDEDQLWAPKFVLFTDQGEILSSGEGVNARIENDIRSLLGSPLLETQNEMIGELFQGREHAKEGLVVWPARRTDVNEVSMFIAGISGETRRVRNPVTETEIILRKTLQRNYLIRGDALARGSEPVELVSELWVLR